MADTSHPDPSDVLHYRASEEHPKHRSSSFGFLAIGVVLVAIAAFLAFKLHQQNTNLADVRAQLNGATSDLATAKSNLAAANTNVVNLQSQLEQSHKQTSDLQAQVKKTGETSTDLQAQLDKAHSDAQLQQRQSQSQTTDLQTQVSQANANATSLRKELVTARTQIDDLKGQVAQAKADAATLPAVKAAALRPLPLTSEFKKGFLSHNFTLELKNSGTDPLNLNLQITGADSTPSRAATIEGGGTFKLDGLAPGAKIVITSDGFESMTLTAQ